MAGFLFVTNVERSFLVGRTRDSVLDQRCLSSVLVFEFVCDPTTSTQRNQLAKRR